MQIVPFKAEHIAMIRLQEEQMYLSGWVTQEQADALEHSIAYTALDDGVPVACAGLVEHWEGRASVWAFLAAMGPNRFIAVHRACMAFLDVCYTRRVEMSVDCNFKEAHRWAKMLGFTMEAERMEAYSPDGRSCALYARVLP
jgi:hypothetical protein